MTIKQSATLMALISLGVILSLYIMEYGFGLLPCQLCLWQRWPWYFIAGLSLFVVSFAAKKDKYLLFYLGLIVISFIISSGLGLYHFGVEQGLWLGPQQCTPLNFNIMNDSKSLTQLLGEAEATKTIACDQPAALFLSLSLAAWNMIASLLMAIFTISMIVKHGKNR